MAEQKKTRQTVVSTKATTNYSFIIEKGVPVGIQVEKPSSNITYFFKPEEGQQEVTEKIIKNAIKAFLECNMKGLEIFLTCCQNLDEGNKYKELAAKLFREYWNELYNSMIADSIFRKDFSIDEILSQDFDFFKEYKIK